MSKKAYVCKRKAPWEKEIFNLSIDFMRSSYYNKIISDTKKENPGADDDRLFRMAHKKLMALI